MRLPTVTLLLLLIAAPTLEAEKNLLVVSKAEYAKRLEGFWLGQNIANWTGLITEMDTVGTPETVPFYTDADWGSIDRPSVWGGFCATCQTNQFLFRTRGLSLWCR